ncbi:hypothetical protein WN943_026056 [Citrus x changshan-huyou]
MGGCFVLGKALRCNEILQRIVEEYQTLHVNLAHILNSYNFISSYLNPAWEANPGTSEGTTPSIESWLGVFAAGGSSAEHLNGCLSYSLC